MNLSIAEILAEHWEDQVHDEKVVRALVMVMIVGPTEAFIGPLIETLRQPQTALLTLASECAELLVQLEALKLVAWRQWAERPTRFKPLNSIDLSDLEGKL